MQLCDALGQTPCAVVQKPGPGEVAVIAFRVESVGFSVNIMTGSEYCIAIMNHNHGHRQVKTSIFTATMLIKSFSRKASYRVYGMEGCASPDCETL